MDPLLKKEITDLVNELQSQDSIELGSTHAKIKVYTNFEDKEKASAKISTAISILQEKKKELEGKGGEEQ